MDTFASPVMLSHYTVQDTTAYTATDTGEDELPQFWQGVLAIEDQLTGDGRMFEAGALTWDVPAPLRFVLQDMGAHDGAQTVGTITDIERQDGGIIFGRGTFDLGSEVGREAARHVRDGITTGVSVDLDDISFEVRISAELGEDPEVDLEDLPEDEHGRKKVLDFKTGDELLVTTSARIRGATQVAIPAFKDATLSVAKEVVTASAGPVALRKGWFHVPEPDDLTPLTVTDDGQVYGHLAPWGTCHVAEPRGRGVCVTPPTSPSNYRFFHTGTTLVGDERIPTGRITFSTEHADPYASADATRKHYDHTGTVGADVRAVDGKHGIWVSGAIRSKLSDDQRREFSSAPLSGDWREIDGALELVGILSVNVPGFPVPATRGLVASGSLVSLTAAGAGKMTAVTETPADRRERENLRDRVRIIGLLTRMSMVR